MIFLHFLFFILWGYDAEVPPRNIRLVNPSFEGVPQDATVPVGWLPCETGTTPDIMPGTWGVYQEPSDGDTYMGLITRPDGTFESVGQRLYQSLKKGECYEFGLDLAHSQTYTGYNQALKLRIWGGTRRCSKTQLLFESPTITHSNWKNYKFLFQPQFEYNYILIEAYSPDNKPRMGNILLDNCSTISICDRA